MTYTASRLLFHCTMLLAVAALASCSRGAVAPPPPPEPVVLEVSGASGMNAGGNAAIVRVYMLASDAAFRRTPIQDFWQDDAVALGSDLMGAKREVLLYPGDRETFQLEPMPEVAFVGIAADLREPDPNGWRVIYPVSELRGRRVTVVVDTDRLDARVAGPR
jgi:type VI secretion system VasD/TssJ family lipoprotein